MPTRINNSMLYQKNGIDARSWVNFCKFYTIKDIPILALFKTVFQRILEVFINGHSQ